MKKRCFFWKKKVLLITFSISLVASSIIAPFLIERINTTLTSKFKYPNDYKDKVLLNNSNELEKAISFNLNSVERLDSQISYFNNNFDLETQTNFFSDINTDAVLNHLVDNSNLQSAVMKNKSFNVDNDLMQNHKIELKEIITQIKSGKITPITILEKEKEFPKNNATLYENTYKEIAKNYKKNTNQVGEEFTNKENNLYINTSTANKSYQTSINRNTTEPINSLNSVDITINSSDSKFILDLENTRNRLSAYQDKVYGVSITAAILTAISWATAVYYWAAWWMFGANVPFAIGSTIQAGLMTYTTNESWNNYYSIKDAKDQLNKVLYSEEYIQVKDALNYLLHKYTGSQIISDSTITFSIFTLGVNTTYPMLIRYALKESLPKLIKTTANKIANVTGKKILKNVVKNTATYAAKMHSKKALMKSVNWAAPVGPVIGFIDTLLSIIGFGIDMIYIQNL